MLKLIETIGTVRVFETDLRSTDGRNLKMYLFRCSKCGVLGDGYIDEKVTRAGIMGLRAANGRHVGCDGVGPIMNPGENPRTPEFVAHLVCGHWIGIVTIEGEPKCPTPDMTIDCPFDGQQKVEWAHTWTARHFCKGDCKREIFSFAVPVEVEHGLASKGYKA